MPLNKHMRIVGTFTDPRQAEAALQELKNDDFPMNQVSSIMRDAEHLVPPNSKAQERTNIGAIAGGAVGGVLGLIVGLGTMAAIPGVGPIVLLGGAATALATTLTGGVTGAATGGLIGALISYGLPEDQAHLYSDRIHQGHCFVMVEGSEADIRQAEAVLSRWHAQELRIDTIPAAVSHPVHSGPFTQR